MKKMLMGLMFFAGVTMTGAAQPSLVNGGFETGNFSGWTPAGAVSINNTQPRTGSFAAAFGPGAAALSQNVTTQAGLVNNVRFFLANSGAAAPAATFQVQFGSTIIAPVFLAPAPVTGYQEFIVSFLAAGASTNLNFTSSRPLAAPGAFLLDDVEIFIPELNAATATLPLLLVAGLLFVAADRRRAVPVPAQQ